MLCVRSKCGTVLSPSKSKECFFTFQVSTSLMKIESVNNFTDFVKAFSQFGGEMVELAHLTGDRQNVSSYSNVPKYSRLTPLFRH